MKKIKKTKKNVFIVKSVLFLAMVAFLAVFGIGVVHNNIVLSIIGIILSIFFGGCFGELDELSSEWFDTDEEKNARINYTCTWDEYKNRED